MVVENLTITLPGTVTILLQNLLIFVLHYGNIS